ncbi:MAG: hypothetical protein ACYSTS_03310 [Planctomycetota bacterium]|jgi:valyl-tRNA synthetase
MVGTTNEKKLKNDIYKKNMIRSEIEKQMSAVSRWKEKLANLRNFQGQAKYTDSIKRYIAEIERLRTKLNQMNEEVDTNIRALGKFSDSEVNEFCSLLEQELSEIEAGKGSEKNKIPKEEIKELKNARTKLAELKGRGNVQEKIEKARKKVGEDIEEIEQATGKITKLNRHLRKVSVGAGSTAGDNDEFLYTQELKSIAREKAIYG